VHIFSADRVTAGYPLNTLLSSRGGGSNHELLVVGGDDGIGASSPMTLTE